ncbi:MAG: DUF2752 domain-containing protein [Deltaproteobacteria bacterium]|nr:DUF2752 domain-containing protein [Deltaproteobacteria bacterium]
MRGTHLAILVLALGAWGVVLIAALASGDTAPQWLQSIAGVLGSCPYRAFTGEPCSLCGTTTAARLLLSGDLAASVSHNPLALGLVVLGVTQPIYRLIRTLRPSFALREELAISGAGLVWLIGVVVLAS